MAELIVILKGRELKRVPVTRTDMAIGRDPRAEVQIENVGVSRVHAVVRYREGVFRVHDHGSSNGISINGMQRTVHPLRDGDEIQVGKFAVRFAEHTGPQAPSEDNSARTDLEDVRDSSLADKTTALSPIELEKLALLPRSERAQAPPPDLDDDVTHTELENRNRERFLTISLIVAVVIIAVLAIALFTR